MDEDPLNDDSSLLGFCIFCITVTPVEPDDSPTIVGQCEIIGVVPEVQGSSNECVNILVEIGEMVEMKEFRRIKEKEKIRKEQQGFDFLINFYHTQNLEISYLSIRALSFS